MQPTHPTNPVQLKLRDSHCMFIVHNIAGTLCPQSWGFAAPDDDDVDNHEAAEEGEEDDDEGVFVGEAAADLLDDVDQEEREGGEEDEGEIVLEVVQLRHEAVEKARHLEDCCRRPVSQSVHWWRLFSWKQPVQMPASNMEVLIQLAL